MTDTSDWTQGFIHVYTGDGKGKTTAALGLALRAAGAGLRVLFAQFVKGMRYSEVSALERLSDLVTMRQYGRSCFIRKRPEREDIDAARAGLDEIRAMFDRGGDGYRLFILDEANIATHFDLFSADELLDLLDRKPRGAELVITGRKADPRVLERADLVTEMREVKHYYAKGVEARTGIEC
jgi:cob(I)alamin adenosyltransferase